MLPDSFCRVRQFPKGVNMKKMNRIQALVLAVLMLCAVLTGCQQEPVQTTAAPATTVPSGPADYTVKLVDPLGNPLSNVGVKFLQNGDSAGMSITNDEGVAKKNLERGDYTLQLTFQDVEHSFVYSQESLQLTASKTETEIVVSYAMGDKTYNMLAPSTLKLAYTLTIAGSNITIAGATDTSLDGTYSFTQQDNALDLGDSKVTIEKNLTKAYTFFCDALRMPQNILCEDGSVMTEVADGTYTVMSNEYVAYYVDEGCTTVKLSEAGRNYFIFAPIRAGIYEISVVGKGVVGDFGTPNFVYGESYSEAVNGSFQKTITSDMIGTNGTGTTEWVLGVDIDTANEETYLCIRWISEPPKTITWESYAPTYRPTKYTLPEGAVLMDFDLSAETYQLVYNENDKFYHLNTADGPIVLVRLLSANPYTGFAFGNILLGANIGAHHYDDNGVMVEKILYNDCMHLYLGNITGSGESAKFTGGTCDDNEGVYPLTKDLALILQDYGTDKGYWEEGNLEYLFGDVVNLNKENAWLFACCYLG